ncbi:uncharacterized protein LOC104917490 [Meleagris gallopavo]|uniref:uncharacterized protein LOC104917490 n=1 Tax=Meleagris gallopavo TaxID=9103 RepID=UPI000549964C|nr:uncharacterized protein LOC104917490 [Meleagris gallopavo]
MKRTIESFHLFSVLCPRWIEEKLRSLVIQGRFRSVTEEELAGRDYQGRLLSCVAIEHVPVGNASGREKPACRALVQQGAGLKPMFCGTWSQKQDHGFRKGPKRRALLSEFSASVTMVSLLLRLSCCLRKLSSHLLNKPDFKLQALACQDDANSSHLFALSKLACLALFCAVKPRNSTQIVFFKKVFLIEMIWKGMSSLLEIWRRHWQDYYVFCLPVNGKMLFMSNRGCIKSW